MKPSAIYFFRRMSENSTRYKQIRQNGMSIPGFYTLNKRGQIIGGKNITFREKEIYYGPLIQDSIHVLELEEYGLVTDVFFTPELPRQSYGAYKTYGQKYGLLIEFSENFERLTIWFFSEKQEAVYTLFQKWRAGETTTPEMLRLSDTSNFLSYKKRLSLLNSGGLKKKDKGEKRDV